MKKLLKDYDLKQDIEYFDLCYFSLINGNITQTKEQFKMMKRIDRKRCYQYFDGFWDVPTREQRQRLNFFLDLI